jgi:UDP-N-acetylglucosamine--N-acetylmuramyl-(pentapeptide) pyrophosphoryl-undecaprenol N-acetylglucosamine transferase
VGVGGYSSFPVLRYAQAKGIKTFIHEANSFGGKANMMLARRAEKVFVATDNMEKFFPSERLMVTGNPVRKCILSMNISKDAGLKFFGLQPNRKTVFVFGGSLGASSINKGIASGLDRLLEQNLQVIWQTGKEFTEEASQLVKDKAGVWTSAFITDIENAYAAADVVVSRAGAMSVSELCVVGKPVIFVPYPHAAEDHQTANAMALVNKRAALIVNDAEVKSRLVDEVLRVVSSPALALELSTNISKLKITNADEVVALEILQSLNVPG